MNIMRGMLILTNPPFGYRAKLSKQIVKTVLPVCDQAVVLQPSLGYRPFERNVYKAAHLCRGFQDVALYYDRFKICLLKNEELDQTFDDVNAKLMSIYPLYKKLKDFNKDKPRIECELIDAASCRKHLARIEAAKDRCFFMTQRQFTDFKVHRQGHDVDMNLKGDSIYNHPYMVVEIFRTPRERQFLQMVV